MIYWQRRSISKNIVGLLLFLAICFVMFVPFGSLTGRVILLFDDIDPALQPVPALVVVLLVTILLTRRYDRMPAAWSGLGLHRWTAREIGIGAGIGLAGATVAWMPVALLGSVTVEVAGITVGAAISTITLLILLAALEELLFRGYLLHRVAEIVGPVTASLLTALGFAASHLGNPGGSVPAFINVFIAGLLFAGARFATGSLWMPIALHAGWNVSTGFLYGARISGFGVDTALLRTHANGLPLLTGGDFGPEGGLASTLALLAAGVAIARFRLVAYAPWVFSRIFWHVYRRESSESARNGPDRQPA